MTADDGMAGGDHSGAVVQLDGVRLVRNGRQILRGIDWRIEGGQHWALLGANGAGKTSLLKVILGYEWPTAGVVRVLGRTFGQADIPAVRRRIGWVGNVLTTQLNGRERGWEIVAGGLDAALQLYRGVTDGERHRIRRALEVAGAAGCEDRPYGWLSQGEQQRVLIARALVHEPALLILDEPCVGLDPAARWRFLDDMERLAGRPGGPSMVWVTHHVEELGPWIGHAMVLKDGRVVSCGPIGSVLCGGVMAEAFDCNCRLVCRGRTFALMRDEAAEPAADAM